MSEELKAHILDEQSKGNVVFWGMPGELMAAPLNEFVEQPAMGILYDLNRLEEITMTFINDPKWVNDYAVAAVIRKLVEQRDEARAKLAQDGSTQFAPQATGGDHA